jgi:hypothetical protein
MTPWDAFEAGQARASALRAPFPAAQAGGVRSSLGGLCLRSYCCRLARTSHGTIPAQRYPL